MMKYNGCILEFTAERNDELLRAYRYHLSKAKVIRAFDIATAVVNSPAPRFWVSRERATEVISAMLANRPLPHVLRPTKVEMFNEIFRRVLDLRRVRPNDPLVDLVDSVVNSPAPKFYMHPRSAMILIHKTKKLYFEKFQQHTKIRR
jgi:hypothetical protein